MINIIKHKENQFFIGIEMFSEDGLNIKQGEIRGKIKGKSLILNSSNIWFNDYCNIQEFSDALIENIVKEAYKEFDIFYCSFALLKYDENFELYRNSLESLNYKMHIEYNRSLIYRLEIEE